MAIRPEIALQTRVPDVGSAISNALLNAQRIQGIRQAKQEAPLRNQLLEAEAGMAQTEETTARRRERLINTAQTALGLRDPLQRAIDTGNTAEVEGLLNTNIQNIMQRQAAGQDIDATESIEALQQLKTQGPQALLNSANDVIGVANRFGLLKGAGVDRSKFVGTPQRIQRQVTDPQTGQETTQNFLSGVVQNADGSFTRQDIPVEGSFVSTLGETGQEQTQRVVTEAGGKEAAKLAAKFKLEPQVKAAVATAVSDANRLGKVKAEDRSNQRAFDVYSTSMNNLVESLGGTVTGPFAGLTPALTTNQQIADGAVAAVLPVLKQVFRAAGEGVFTDKDQELLLGLAPTRKDTPEARVAKVNSVDAIVRAKLGITDNAQPQNQQAPQQQGGIKFLGFE